MKNTIDSENPLHLRSAYNYELPQELIAQHPSDKRDECRLMVCRNGSICDRVFSDIIEYLDSGDVLVVNRSKVIPARLILAPESEKRSGMTELLLLNDQGNDIWECLAHPGRRARSGDVLVSPGGELTAEVISVEADGNRKVRFVYDHSVSFLELLDSVGQMPLPPYITEKLDDNNKYQTVYAKEYGSAAAPTAGLHFTNELLDRIREKGVHIAEIILHVGLGTFRPVKEENILDHKMHTEHYIITRDAAETINAARHAGKRVIAVGTTSLRTLEGAYSAYCGSKPGADIPPCSGDTGIFIYPGFSFMTADALVTNFHLPESTLLMLVSAFYGYEDIMNAYRHAIIERYRFFSFGDAMYLERPQAK